MLTRATRDYYAVLGVARDAAPDTIKKAFRALAARHHPDVSHEPDAADRFREIAEAYEVLSSPDRRARYDRRGFARASGHATRQRRPGPSTPPGPPGDPFDAAAAPPRGPGERGRDILVGIDLDAEEARRGAYRGVRYAAVAVCGDCDGSGARPGSRWGSCRACAGSGRVREVGRAGAGRVLRLRACSSCGGLGRIVDNPCALCRGRGRLEEERALLVRFPAGSADGDELRLAGQGHAGSVHGDAGDVVVRVRVAGSPGRSFLGRLFRS